MKDYSFGDLNYQSCFILEYYVRKYQIDIFYANGKVDYMENKKENIEYLDSIMALQVEKAYQYVQKCLINYKKTGLIEYLRQFVAIKLKVKDIYKNKLLLDHLKDINQTIETKKLSWVMQINDLYIQDYFLWNFGKKWNRRLTLNNAKDFSYSQMRDIVRAVPKYDESLETCHKR